MSRGPVVAWRSGRPEAALLSNAVTRADTPPEEPRSQRIPEVCGYGAWADGEAGAPEGTVSPGIGPRHVYGHGGVPAVRLGPTRTPRVEAWSTGLTRPRVTVNGRESGRLTPGPGLPHSGIGFRSERRGVGPRTYFVYLQSRAAIYSRLETPPQVTAGSRGRRVGVCIRSSAWWLSGRYLCWRSRVDLPRGALAGLARRVDRVVTCLVGVGHEVLFRGGARGLTSSRGQSWVLPGGSAVG